MSKENLFVSIKHSLKYAPIAQLVEQLPFKETVEGSNPPGRTSLDKADLAQLVEQLSCKQQVVGPSPTVGSVKKKAIRFG